MLSIIRSIFPGQVHRPHLKLEIQAGLRGKTRRQTIELSQHP